MHLKFLNTTLLDVITPNKAGDAAEEFPLKIVLVAPAPIIVIALSKAIPDEEVAIVTSITSIKTTSPAEALATIDFNVPEFAELNNFGLLGVKPVPPTVPIAVQ